MKRNLLASVMSPKAAMRRWWALLAVLLLTAGHVWAQTDWTGNEDSDWDNPLNWTDGVPDAEDHVNIDSRQRQPVVGGTAVARSVYVRGGGLTIAATGILTVIGKSQFTNLAATVQVDGILENNGQLIVNSEGTCGIYLNGRINNHAGEIRLNGASQVSLNNDSGIFINEAKLSIGSISSAGTYGIRNYMTFENKAGGEVEIDRTAWALYNETNTFTNEGKINIGTNTGVNSYGIYNEATFSNLGEIVVDNVEATSNSVNAGIYNKGSFTNSGSIAIRATNSTGPFGIYNTAVFANLAGQISIDAATKAAFAVVSGSAKNMAKITIGSEGGTTGDGFGVGSPGQLNNMDGAEINIRHIGGMGMDNTGTVNNYGQLLVGVDGSIGSHGISNGGSLTNFAGGVIKVDHTAGNGWEGFSEGGVSGRVENESMITLINGSFNNSNTTLRNSTCATLTVANGNLNNVSSGLIINDGLLNVSGDVNHNGSRFDNLGLLAYGSTSGEPISNVELTVNRDTLPIFGFGPAFMGTVHGIFKDAAATQSAGEYIAPNYFFPDESLPLGPTTLYVKATVGPLNCTFTVAINYMVSGEPSQDGLWTGAVSTAWEDPLNWVDGVPDANDHVTIAPVANQPIVSGAAFASSVHVQVGSSLTIGTSGSLTINGFASYSGETTFTSALHNQGTIDNNGDLVLGSTGPVGAYGIVNQGTFTSGAGASIKINNSDDTALYNKMGVFKNESEITLGDVAPVGYHGIWNDARFNNGSSSTIRIDRSSLRGIVNNSGTFTSEGLIAIGAVADVGVNGLLNKDIFALNGCGRLIISRGALRNEATGSFTSEGLVQIAGEIYTTAELVNFGVLKYGSLSGNVFNGYLIVRDGPAPMFIYGSGFNGTVNNIFSDSEATQPAGTFTPPNTFIPTAMEAGTYPVFAKITKDGGACSYVVPFSFNYIEPTPEISVKGNNNNIPNGGNPPGIVDNTRFGQLFYLSGAVSQSYIIENTGDGDLNLTGTPVVSLTGSPDFTVTTQPAALIAAGGNTTLTITFDPSSVGVKAATVSIASSDADENPFTFGIQGEGVEGCSVAETSGPLTWNGSVSDDWNNRCNWSPTAVPGANNHVVISNGPNQPVIGPGIVALAKSAEVLTGASLTISSTASLTLSGLEFLDGIGTALRNGGVVQNAGQLSIEGVSDFRQYGFWNAGEFTNSGTVSIAHATQKGFWNATGTFTSSGRTEIGGNNGSAGFENSATVNIENCGQLIVLNGNLVNQAGGTIANAGLISAAPTLTNNGTFTNNGILKYKNISGSITNNQLIVGDTPAALFTYGGSFTGTINGIYTDNAATQPAGTFAAPDKFTPNPSLPTGTTTLYLKITPAGVGCSHILAFQYQVLADVTVWNGSKNTSWNDAGNWTVGVPDANMDAVIDDVANDPVIDIAANANSVLIRTGAALTIAQAGSLTVHNSAAYTEPFPFNFTAGLNNLGTLTNNGQLILGSAASVGSYAIVNQGVLENKTGAAIRVDNTTDTGIFNASGTFTNQAEITIGANANVGLHGIWNDAVFNNQTGGDIRIDRSSEKGLVNNADETKSIHATFTNTAAIHIGAVAGAGKYGLHNRADFANNAGGNIAVDNTSVSGIYHASGTLGNAGDITIGATGAVGGEGLNSWSAFDNKAGAHLEVHRASVAGIDVAAGAFSNSGSIVISAAANVMNSGLNCVGNVQNNAGATIEIDDIFNTSLGHALGTFVNDGTILIGGKQSAGRYGLVAQSAFENNSSGVIRIDRVSTTFSNSTGFTHSGGTFNNRGSIKLGGTESAGFLGFKSRGTFNNLSGGSIDIDRTVTTAFENTGTFTNTADITIGGLATSGRYGMELAGPFSNNTGGHIRLDNVLDAAMFVKSPISNAAEITIGASTAVGRFGIELVNNGSFRNAAGGKIVIDRSTDAAITNVGISFDNDAEIIIGGSADAGTYGITNQRIFNNNTGGHIRIDRISDTGIYHLKGTFTNAANITIGGSENVAVHGIFNEGEFANNAGGDIRIDRTGLAGLRNFNGTFSNAAGITIGSVASVGTYGIRNQSAFANYTGGQIKVDRAQQGIYLEDKAFSNAGAVTIGGVSAIGALLTQQGAGTFSNATDGVLKGTGTVASAGFVHAGGTLSPGYSPGKLTFGGSQDFGSSVMDIEVNGTGTAGTDFDQIVVNGTATLGGALHITSAYTPVKGDEVVILSATSVSGTFGTVTGLGEVWKVDYTANSVKLVWADPMPVTLVEFTARAAGTAAQLGWKTTAELNNEGFYIERSANGRLWEEIGYVKGNGTTAVVKDYTFQDNAPKPGLNYYRLRQTDFDGTTEYSSVRAVKIAEASAEVTVWADASRHAHVKTEDRIGRVTIFSLSGRVVASAVGASILDLSFAPAGILVVQVWTDKGVVTRKLLLP